MTFIGCHRRLQWPLILGVALLLQSGAPGLAQAASVKPFVTLPLFKIHESTRANAKLDAALFTGTGGGFTVMSNDGRVSIAPITILVSGDTAKDQPVDLSYACILGFANNKYQLGIGVDFGTVEQGRSRVIGLLSWGITKN